MVASGSISKVQVNYANAAPPSAVLLIDVFAWFLQACKIRVIICLPHPHLFMSLCQGSVASPMVASMATQCCWSALFWQWSKHCLLGESVGWYVMRLLVCLCCFQLGNASVWPSLSPRRTPSLADFAAMWRTKSFSDTWEEEGKKKVLEIL